MEKWKHTLIVSGAILCVGILIAIVASMVGAIVNYFAAIVVYIIVALVLALICRPILTMLDRVKIRNWALPSSIKAILALLTLIVILMGIAAFFVPLVAGISTQISQLDTATLSQDLQEPLAYLKDLNVAYEYIEVEAGETFESQIIKDIGEVVDQINISSIVSGVLGFAGNFFVGAFSIIFITFFFLQDRNLFTNLVLRISPDYYDDRILVVMGNIKSLLTRYLVGLLLELLLVGGLISLGLTILGVPNALFIGYFAGVFNVIPYLGPIIGGSMTTVLTLLFGLNFDLYDYTLPLVAKALAVFLIVQLIDNFVFQPLIYSNSVKAHPLEIFLVILMASYLGGPAGMIIAVPTYTILRVVIQEIWFQFRSRNGHKTPIVDASTPQ